MYAIRSYYVIQNITVPFRYTVSFTHRVFDPQTPTLASVLRLPPAGPARALVVVDAGVAAACKGLVRRLPGGCPVVLALVRHGGWRGRELP